MTPKQYWDKAAKDPDVLTKYICDPIFNTEDFIEVIEEQVEDWDFKEVMEFGCGIGRLLVPLADKYPKTNFYGLDISDEMIKRSPKRDNIQYNIVNYGRTDYVFSMLVFQHMPHSVKLENIRLIHGALRPGGVFYFQFVVGDAEDELVNHQTSIISVTELLESAGFIIQETKIGFMHPEWCFIKAVK